MFDRARARRSLRKWARAAVASLSLLLAIFVFAAPGVARAQDFGDWTVTCDNVRDCAAFGFPASDSDLDGVIAFRRSDGAEDMGKAAVTLYVDGAKGSAPLTLKVDGKPIAGVKTERTGLSGQSGRDGFTTEISPDEMNAFVTALRRGSVLTIAASGGKDRADISLRGAVAALLRMDDLQGRVGTPTALIRKGGKPFVATVPPAPVIEAARLPDIKGNPELATRLRKAQSKYLAKNCDDVSNLEDVSDLVEPLDASRTLVGLVCQTGAYNFTTAFWVVTGGDVAKAAPAMFDAPGAAAGNVLTNVGFDRKTATLDFFHKGRGLGDCGVAGKYVWTGSKFALLSYSEMKACRGLASEDWPTVWRARLSGPQPAK